MKPKTLTNNEIALLKAAWQLSLDHADNEFDDDVIVAELTNQGFDWSVANIGGAITKMLELDLIEVREIGSLYCCTWACSSSSKIELTIVPYNEALHDAVLKAVTEAIEEFGSLVDVEDG